MALWFKLVEFVLSLVKPRKKVQVQPLLEYNLRDLAGKMQLYSMDLYGFRGEDSWRIIKKVIETARNIQILEVNRNATLSTTSENLAYSQGRLKALDDLVGFIELSFDASHQESLREKEKPKGKLLRKTIKNHGHQAVI